LYLKNHKKLLAFRYKYCKLSLNSTQMVRHFIFVIVFCVSCVSYRYKFNKFFEIIKFMADKTLINMVV